jgi:hypothetical protein
VYDVALDNESSSCEGLSFPLVKESPTSSGSVRDHSKRRLQKPELVSHKRMKTVQGLGALFEEY